MRTIWAVFVLMAMMPSISLAQGATNYTAEFLGWNPNSTEFAYVLTRHRRSGAKKHFTYMKGISPNRRRAVPRYTKFMLDRVKKIGFVTHELERLQSGTYEHSFKVGPDIRLRITLAIGAKRLTYNIYVDDMSQSPTTTRIMGGKFKEIWTDFIPRAYASPDKKWVTVVLAMSTPFRSRVWVEGIRVSATP